MFEEEVPLDKRDKQFVRMIYAGWISTVASTILMFAFLNYINWISIPLFVGAGLVGFGEILLTWKAGREGMQHGYSFMRNGKLTLKYWKAYRTKENEYFLFKIEVGNKTYQL